MQLLEAFLSALKHRFLTPGFECLELFWSCCLLLFGLFNGWFFCLFLCCLLGVFVVGYLLNLWLFISEFLAVEVDDSKIYPWPLLPQIPLTRGVNADSFLLHDHQLLDIELPLLLVIIYITTKLPPFTFTKSSNKYKESMKSNKNS